MTDKASLKAQLELAGYSYSAIQNIFEFFGWEAWALKNFDAQLQQILMDHKFAGIIRTDEAVEKIKALFLGEVA